MGKFSVRLCASALIVLIALNIAVTSIILPTNVNAAPAPPGGGGTTPTPTTPVPTTDPATLYLAPEVLADATASEYRTSLALCMTNGGSGNLTDGYGDRITAQHVAKGPWFSDVNVIRPGILVWGNADDYISCYDLISYNPAQGLGISDNVTLACDIGLTRVDGKDCLTDPDQSDFTDKNINGDKNKLYANIDAHRTNASAPPTGGWNDAQKYVDVMATLTKFCKANAIADVGGPLATPTVAAQYHDTQYSVVDGNGNITKVYYNVPDKGKKAMLMNFEDNFNWWEQSCQELTSYSNQYAPAYAAYVKANPESTNSATGGASTGNSTPDKTSCVISGIGWLVCPVMRFMAQVTDQAYSVVSGLLTTPALDSNTSSSMYTAWSTLRNFANVGFIIAFLVIVYSQITGVGISNYGIKRMLPRIIIAAILANVSYWICAIAIDISNILGTSMAGLFNVPIADLSKGGASVASSGAGGGWDVLTVAAITGVAGAALVFVGLSVLIPLLLAALVAVVTTVVALTVRQAVIVLITAISSLAFVAYVLDEPLFHRIRKIFQAMLVVFPATGLVFGACNLAAAILDVPGAPFLLQVVGQGVKIVPLFAVPFLIKGATSVLGKVGGWINNPNKGPVDRMRRGAEGYRQNRQEYRKLKALNGYRTLPGRGVLTRRNAERQAVLNNRKSELNRATSGYIAGLAQDNEGFRGRLAQGGDAGAQQRALATAINVQANLRADEVKAEHANIAEANIDDPESLMKLIKGESVSGLKAAPGSALQTAAIEQLAKTGDVKKMDELIMMSGSKMMDVQQRQAIAEGMKSMTGKVKYYGGGASAAVAAGKVNSESDLNKLVADSVEAGKYGVEELQNGDHDALTRVANVTADPNSVTSDKVKADGTIDPGKPISDQQKLAIRDAATELRTNDNLKKPSPRVQDRLLAIEHGVAYPSP